MNKKEAQSEALKLFFPRKCMLLYTMTEITSIGDCDHYDHNH